MLGSLFMDVGLVSDFLNEVKVCSLFFIIGVFLEMLSFGTRFLDFYGYHSFGFVG